MLIDIYAQRSATSTSPVVSGLQAAPALLPIPHAALLHASLTSSPAYGRCAFGPGEISGVGRKGAPVTQGTGVSIEQHAPAGGVPPRGGTG